MNRRAALTVYLVEAEEQVERTALLVMRHRDLMRQLGHAGQETTAAAAVLNHLEQLQAQHLAERDRLRDQLTELGPRRVA
jgi:hypothetical protein